jgi:hypothetical protein
MRCTATFREGDLSVPIGETTVSPRRRVHPFNPACQLTTTCNGAPAAFRIGKRNKIKKGQFKIGKLGGRTARMPEIWQAALAA